MKHLWLMLTVLLVLAAALAGLALPPRARPWADCTSRVVTGRGPHGEPVECVCLEGGLSTCLDSGP
jgi:hypothetical protein